MNRSFSQRVWLGRRDIQTYRGRQVCADTDLHVRAIELLREVAPERARAVDVGCGQGAFTVRLADAGFSVTGIDVDPPSEGADPSGARFERLDLLSDDARAAFLAQEGGNAELVVLMEVIEHVRDPWQVLSFCRDLLRPGGVLLVSTPNVTNFFSRFRFLTSGRLHQFEPGDLSYGHINPMTAMMVGVVMEEVGLRLEREVPGPRMPVLVWDTNIPSLGHRLFHCVSWLVAAALTPLMRGGHRDGWSLFFVARRP